MCYRVRVSPRSAIAALWESVSLSSARRRALGLDARTRADALDRLLASSERSRGAATLWARGERPQALVLMTGALDAAIEASTAAGCDPDAKALAVRPESEARSRWAQGTRYRALRRASASVRRQTARAIAAPADVTARRAVRVLALAVTVAAMTLALLAAPRRATGSTTYSDDHRASHAIDGDPSTEWLLEDRTPGTLTITGLHGAIHRVRILNARNALYFDRGTKQFEIEALSGTTRVGRVTGELPSPAQTGRYVDVAIAASDVSELRVRVIDYHGLGGGIAEVVIE